MSLIFKRLTLAVVSLVLVNRASAEPAMWVIRDKDSTIYMIGTVHLLRRGTEWQTPKVTKALAESQELWLEIADADDTKLASSLMAQYGQDKEKPLSKKLNFIERAKLAKIAADYDLKPEALENLQPWAAGILFTVLPLTKAGFDPNAGVDESLKADAKKRGEPIRGFETTEAQVRFFANLSEKDQIAFLDDSLDDAEKGMETWEKTADAWLQGDSKTIAEALNDHVRLKFPTLYRTLIVRRNERWTDQIEQLLNGSGVQFIAVGAAHLVGPDRIQAQLASRGIKVEQY